jgi:hypothetical protein
MQTNRPILVGEILGKTIQSATEPRVETPPNDERTPSIAGAPVDRELEASVAALSAARGGVVDSEREQAVTSLRARHNQPGVALRLAELMMTSPDQTIRQLAEFALVGTQDREGSSLLQAEYMIRKTNEGGGKFGTGPENAEELIAGLKEVREHPLVAARLVETVISGSSGAYYAAMVLQGTPDKATERSLKHALSAALDRGFGAGFELRDMWQVPRALKYSQDPDTQALIIRALKEGDEAFGTNNLRFQAACAMGAINTSEVRALAIEKVMSTRQDWGVRRGIAQAIRELDAEEVDARILPLIEGSDLKTAWILAGEQRSNGLGRVAKWVSLISSEREVVHDIRVQVGLALQERHPDLAAKVFDDALKGERNPFKHRCQFFAAGDALRALQAREATT